LEYWLHGNSIPKMGCHYFWPGLTALPKKSLPILGQGHFLAPPMNVYGTTLYTSKVQTHLDAIGSLNFTQSRVNG